MQVLLEKAKAEALDATEQTEMQNFQKADRSLELMKARARISLQQVVG